MHIIDAPLGLANVLTVLCALICLWTVLPEKRRGVIQARLLALSAGLAGVVALVLGAVIGRARGWSLPFEIALPGGIAGLRARWDGVFVAAGIAAAAFLDFASAALEQPVIHPIHIAALAAFCAGFLGSRALAILVRLERRTH